MTFPRAAIVAGLSLLVGCAGYQIGVDSLYRPDIRTVHVPVFRSQSLRRHLGERLTEAVVRKIDTVTSYRVTDPDRADSTLRGRILADSKAVLGEDAFDAPRVLESRLVIQFEWVDRSGRPLTQLNPIPIPGSLLQATQAETFIPEAGQSLATSQQKALDRLADQIVAQMEGRW